MSFKVRLGKELNEEDLISMRREMIKTLKDKELKPSIKKAWNVINFKSRHDYYWDKKTSTFINLIDFILLLSAINKRLYNRGKEDTTNTELIDIFQSSCLRYDNHGNPIYSEASEKSLKKACKCYNEHRNYFPPLTFNKLKIYKWRLGDI